MLNVYIVTIIQLCTVSLKINIILTQLIYMNLIKVGPKCMCIKCTYTKFKNIPNNILLIYKLL